MWKFCIGLVMVLLISGCEDEKDLLCGPYPELSEYGEGEVLQSNFQNSKSLELISRHGFMYDFRMKDGDSMVFHTLRYFRGEAPDAYHEEHLLFQLPEGISEIFISSSEFKKYKVFFRNISHGSGNGFLSDDGEGCIHVKKMNTRLYEVSVNIINDNYPPGSTPEKEVRNIAFTTSFVEGPSYHDPGMKLGQD